MVKLVESIRLDEWQREILKMKAKALGVTPSEYIRSLIEKDNMGRFVKVEEGVTLSSWRSARSSVVVSESQVALLEAFKKEFEKVPGTEFKRVETLQELVRKYGLDSNRVIDDLNVLVKNGILIRGSKEKGYEYMWTKQGILMLPEFASAASVENTLIHGDVTTIFTIMFGDYDEMVDYVTSSLEVSKEEGDAILHLVLGGYALFLSWLREFSFRITGIASSEETSYFRRQALNFLFSYMLTIRNQNETLFDQNTRAFLNDLLARLSTHFSIENKK